MGKLENKRYQKKVHAASPSSPVGKNCLWAFSVGGGICAVGELLHHAYTALGAAEEDAAMWVSVTLIFLGALLTGIGWYDDLARRAGAGTLVPITGFANAVVSPALEYKTEGMITGTAAKLFAIAGPVIVYGTVSAALFGWLRLFLGLI